jgi:DNA-binding transcriptional ArsR family regulator
MTDRDFILAPLTVQVRLSVEVVYNALNNLLLLNLQDRRSGLSSWVSETAAAMPPELRRRNQVVGALFGLIEPMGPAPDDFPTYIEQLVQEDMVNRRDSYLSQLSERLPSEITPQRLLDEPETFTAQMQRLYAEKDDGEEADLYAEVYALINDVDALRTLLIGHLREMWDRWLAADWKRSLPVLEEAVNTFQELDFNDLTALEAARAITGRDMGAFWTDSDRVREAVFVPSAHIGPYVTLFRSEDTAYVIFGARVPEGVRPKSSDLTRSELLIHLNALADDTRLRILELVRDNGELCAQDVIAMMNVSQSSASRHLRQLTASGYLIERRRDVAKCYTVNPGRFKETTLALRLYLGLS